MSKHSQIEQSGSSTSPVIRFLFENSLFLVGGAAVALVWANVDGGSYRHFIHLNLFPSSLGQQASLQHVVNDALMALFFAIAAKEVWESMLPGGPLSTLKTASTPLLATLGGVLVPAGVYLAGAASTGELSTLGRGWAIPCATDIAFSYLVARIVFGPTHPAITFLLLLAIVDDAIGLVILAIAYPKHALHPEWLLMAGFAIVLALGLRRSGVRTFWWYLLGPGVLCWVSFHNAGIHAALGLVPVVPTMPHAEEDPGIFSPGEESGTDTLNEFSKWWKNPVELILGLFGFVNAGIGLSNTGTATWLVLAGLMLGKPLGISVFTFLGERLFKLERPPGLIYRDVFVLGVVAGIGFTVALFVSTAAFPTPGPIQDSAKMGALGSFFVAVVAVPLGRLVSRKDG